MIFDTDVPRLSLLHPIFSNLSRFKNFHTGSTEEEGIDKIKYFLENRL